MNEETKENGNHSSVDGTSRPKISPSQSKVASIAMDYPELCSDYSDFINHDSKGPNQSPSQKIASSLNGLSPLNSSQIISKRLKMDLRNETETPIAGKAYFWN